MRFCDSRLTRVFVWFPSCSLAGILAPSSNRSSFIIIMSILPTHLKSVVAIFLMSVPFSLITLINRQESCCWVHYLSGLSYGTYDFGYSETRYFARRAVKLAVVLNYCATI